VPSRASGRHRTDRGPVHNRRGTPLGTRLEFIRQTGTVFPKYGIMETGPVGYGCLDPAASDALHLLDDLHAGGVSSTELQPSILFTSLRLSAPLVLLNVSIGDQAELVKRQCQCPLENSDG